MRCVVLTISDTRHEGNDTSGDAIVGAAEGAGHQVATAIVKDDPAPVRSAVQSAEGAADVVITTGGTGITARDTTYEAIEALLDKRIDGFGELFRMLSYRRLAPRRC